MSNDIESFELEVLRTIPFDKVHIELFLIEVLNHIVHFFRNIYFQTAHSNETAITQLMTKNGYKMKPMPPYDHIYFKK